MSEEVDGSDSQLTGPDSAPSSDSTKEPIPGQQPPQIVVQVSKTAWTWLVALLVLFVINGAMATSQASADSDPISVTVDRFQRATENLADQKLRFQEYRQILAGIKKDSSLDAARLRVVVNADLGLPNNKNDLKKLSASKSSDVALANCFGLSLIHPSNAPALIKQFDHSSFLGRFAIAVADRKFENNPKPYLDLVGHSSSSVLAYGLLSLPLATMAAGFLVLVFFFAFSRHIQNEGHPLESLGQSDSNRLALRSDYYFAMWFTLQIVVATGFGLLLGGSSKKSSSSTVELWLETALELVTVILAILITQAPVGGAKVPLKTYGLTWGKFKNRWYWAIPAIPATIFLVGLTSILTSHLFPAGDRPEHPLLRALSQNGAAGGAAWAALLVASILAPIFEELLFRGSLLAAFLGKFNQRQYGMVAAVAMTSLLFAAGHPTGPESWIPLAMVGVVNCVLVIKSGSLWPAIINHAGFNTFSLIQILVLRKFGMA